MSENFETDSRPVLTIDLGVVVDNWRKVAAMARGAEPAAAVKANAYGLGMEAVARSLAAAGAKTFFVATPEEGVALRRVQPSADIYILNGLPLGTASLFLAHRLRPSLKSLPDVQNWAASGQGQPAALHIDSGLNRLGLGLDDVAALAAQPALLAGIDLTLVMSHLIVSEEQDNPLNRQQLANFSTAVQHLGLSAKPQSLAASSGIFLGPDFHFQMVRPGASIYGLNPLINQPNPMRQAVKLEGKILQTRRVDAGMSVGYGATHLVRKPGRIATVGIGYADGFMRRLGNRAFVFIGEQRIPIVGRISMDLITLDVSALAEDEAGPGTIVQVLGAKQSPDELATFAETNGYEILTSLGPRYRRVYVGGA
jgi:alanine racemase